MVLPVGQTYAAIHGHWTSCRPSLAAVKLLINHSIKRVTL